MRYSIIVLFLLINFGLHAFQPKAAAAKKELTAQEFVQEMQRPASYLSLLTPDLKQKIKKDMYPVKDEIAAIRKKYLTSDPESMLKFLNDKDFNQKIIDDLAQLRASNIKVVLAIMLNTPASFEIAAEDNMFKNYVVPNFKIFTLVFADYIDSAIIDCEQVLEYEDFFKYNMRAFKARFLKEYQDKNPDIILQQSMQKTLERLEDQTISDINRLVQSKFKQLNKEEGGTCVVQ